MIFKIDLDNFLNKLLQEFSYLRYNDTFFVLISEDYYSRFGVAEKPWREPKTITMHRSTAELVSPDPKQKNFEKDSESFVDFCKSFFDYESTQHFANLKHFLFTGKEANLKATEVANWETLEDVFKSTKLEKFLSMERRLIRIPCGSLNINLVSFSCKDAVFCEVTGIYDNAEDEKAIEKLQKKLQLPELKSKEKQYWTDLWINHSIAARS